MELDNKAINFIQQAKAQGYSKEEVGKFLQEKGYDIGETPQDNYSALDKAKYIGRAGAEGLTFGLGDMVAGHTNVLANDLADITHGQDFKTRAKGVGNLLLHAYVPSTSFFNKDFKEGRKNFVNEQEAFAQEHPYLNIGGELAGGLVTGVGSAGKGAVKALAKPTIGAMIKGGAKEGAKFGALYGLGSGFTEDADRLSVANALKGAGVGTLGGAVLGGALPVGIAGVVAGGKYLGRPLVTGGKKVADYFRNKTVNTLVGANKGLVEQSIKEGKPLIDIADQKLMDVAEGANLLNREAKQTFADYGKARIEGQHPKLVETLGEYFDKKGSHQLQDELKAETLLTSKPLYDKSNYVTDKAGNLVLDNAGNPVGKIIPEFEVLQGEDAPFIAEHINKVYNNKTDGYKWKKIPQNDMRVLDQAKRKMDDTVKKLYAKGDETEAKAAEQMRDAFIEKLDKANPEYKAARANYERGMKAKSALEQGKTAMSEGERENLLYDYNKLNPEEKFYFRKGVGNALEKASNQKAEGGNVYHKVFDAETRRRLKTLDIPNYDKLEKFALDEMKAASNINSLRGGSPTADRLEAIKRFALGVIRRPTRTITNVLANTAFKPFYANPAEVAKAMTDPVFLSKLYAQAEKNGGKGAGRSVIEALNQIGRMAGGTAEEAQSNLNIRQIINDATKPIKNKGGYIGEKPISQFLKQNSSLSKEDFTPTLEKLLKPRDFVSDNFVSDVNNVLKDNSINNYQKIDMGQIPWVYIANGLEEQPLKTNKLAIRKAMGLLSDAELKAHPEWHNHNVPKDVIDKMPELIADPLAIFKSNTEKGKYVAVLDAKVKGDPVVAIISPSKDGGYTFMPTAYEKESFANFVKNTQGANNVLYVDTKRSSLPHTLLQAVSVGNNDPTYSIATKEGIVKGYFDGLKKFSKGSKVVDEKGNPLTMYHSTKSDFNTFDLGEAGKSNENGAGIGFWFFPNKENANNFAKGTWYGDNKSKVMQTYLNLKNPKIYESSPIDTKAINGIEDKINSLKKENESIKNILSWGEISVGSRAESSDEAFWNAYKYYFKNKEDALKARKFWKNEEDIKNLRFQQKVLKNTDAYDHFQNDLDEFSTYNFHPDGIKDYQRGVHTEHISRSNAKEAIAKLKQKLMKEGYDGIIIKGTKYDAIDGKPTSQYVAFSPNQIKSVFNKGTFDKKNPNIYKALIGGVGISQILNNKENK